MNARFFFLAGLLYARPRRSSFRRGRQTNFHRRSEVVEEPYKFSAEFTIEQAYIGGSDVQRGSAAA